MVKMPYSCEILDDIVDANRNFGYAHFSLITEWCCDVLKLIELAERGGEP